MCFLEPGLETSPPHTNGSVNADEDEEWAAEELVEYFFRMYIRRDPSFSPLLGDEVKQIVCRIEGVGFRGGFRFTVDVG